MTISSERKEHEKSISKKDSVISVRDFTIYECNQQQKITADNATKAAQQMATEYKGLWLEYVNIKTEAQNKKIIK